MSPRRQRCEWCGERCYGTTCRAHADLPALHPFHVLIGNGAKVREGSELIANMAAHGPRAPRR